MSLALHRRQLVLASAAMVLARPAAAAQALRSEWPRHQRTPALRLPLLDGDAWSLEAQRGHAVLLNFWASWCEPCRDELPSLVRLAGREPDLRVVAVNYREPADTVRRFADANPLSLPVALDADGAAAKAFDVHAFPSTVAIGADGRVRFVAMGACDWADEQRRGWILRLRAG